MILTVHVYACVCVSVCVCVCERERGQHVHGCTYTEKNDGLFQYTHTHTWTHKIHQAFLKTEMPSNKNVKEQNANARKLNSLLTLFKFYSSSSYYPQNIALSAGSNPWSLTAQRHGVQPGREWTANAGCTLYTLAGDQLLYTHWETGAYVHVNTSVHPHPSVQHRMGHTVNNKITKCKNK